jgi:hypothetical protein
MIRTKVFASVFSATIIATTLFSAMTGEPVRAAATQPVSETAVRAATEASYRAWARQLLESDLRSADRYVVSAGVSADQTGLTAALQSTTRLLALPTTGATVSLYSTSAALLRMALDRTQREVRQAKARFTLNVWTSSRLQASVNACRGGVAWQGNYASPTVVEHWLCGGSAFPRKAGAVVTLTGYHAGTYRVIGIVKQFDAFRSTFRVVPSGYTLLFQTCMNNSAHTTILIGLAPVKA